MPKCGGRSPPYFGMAFGAAGAAQTPKTHDFRPAQKSCIKHPSAWGQFGPDNVFKPYSKPISGVPEIGFEQFLSKFSGPLLPKPYPKSYLENLVEYPTCPLHGAILVIRQSGTHH
jgi:hypothetical protein